MRAIENRPRTLSRRLLVPAFLAIGVVLVAMSLVALHRARTVHRSSRSVVTGTLASVEMVSQLAREIDQQRLLIDQHIFERRLGDMQRVEQRLGEVEAAFAATARAYDRLPPGPAERATWENLERAVDALHAPLDHVLALSRRNFDVEARAAMIPLDAQYAQISAETAELIRINRTEADRAMARWEALHRSSNFLLALLLALGLSLVGFVATVVTRLMAQREGELWQHLSAVEEQNRELDAFAGRVAHDLRGPLTTVSLAASRLVKRLGDPKSGDVLQRGLERMDSVIEDLLSLSRIHVESRGAQCDPAAAAAEVREDLAPRLQKEGATLRMQVEPARCCCAQGLLRQALFNLADNAIKYRRAGVVPEVLVIGRAAGERYVLTVADNGLGMSPDEVAQAFAPFFRAARSAASGTGLGLSIVKRVVEASGGQVGLESQLGEGTKVTIELPITDEC